MVVVLVVDLNFDGDGDVNRDGHALTLGRDAREPKRSPYPITRVSASASSRT